ncbi:hypothetical protein [Meiothermus taiwanensis]|uniref:hypothetical protein n=1 Tax=Meiothermus taiwanensis TaxID=172827 RepID=UPI0012DC8E9F
MNNMTPSLHIDSKTLTQAVVQDIARHIPDKTTFTVDELAEFLESTNHLTQIRHCSYV